MLIELLKSFLIGICAAVPFGPVLIMVSQKTLTGSRKLGFFSGLGSMTIDTLYATAGLFALVEAKAFLQAHQTPVLIGGGIILAVIGFFLTRKKVDRNVRTPSAAASGANGFSSALQTALCALSNPGAILMIAVLLAFFRLDARSISIPVWAFALAVACGEAFYWYVLTGIVKRFGNFKDSTMQKITKIAGLLIIGFAAVLLVKAIIDLI